MYYYLLNTLKGRLIEELQDSFSRHPVYSKIVPYIQNRYSFKERPQFGIVVKGASGNKVALSANNFVGTLKSYTMLAYHKQPVFPLEWVREDLAAIQVNGDRPASLPGVYYLEILKATDKPQVPGSFVLYPLYTVEDEGVIRFQSGLEKTALLQHKPSEGTLRLWLNRKYLLEEGKDYTFNPDNLKVTFQGSYRRGAVVTADYRYAGEPVGPHDYFWNTANHTALPGVILAFGKRAAEGDVVAVVVQKDRGPAAEVYGGKHEFSFDLDVIAQDPAQAEEIADLVMMFLWGEKKPVLEFEGIEILDVSLGGEGEETYDETADLFMYTASISVQCRADWEIHVPLPLTFSKVTATRANGTSGLVQVAPNNLFFDTMPLYLVRKNQYERIT